MNLEQFGEELKQARVAKELSLMDISAETRISLKLLDAMERGEFQILPQTYARAFLREYAMMVGLNAEDVMERYGFALQESSPQKPDGSATQRISHQEKPQEENGTKKRFSLSPLQRNIAFGVIIVAAIVLIAILANMNRISGSGPAVEEVPFDRVIRENEAASIPPPVLPAADSVPAVNTVPPDSLRLEMTTRDSVWINILIDGKIGQTYLFGAKKKRTWAAKERFIVTMGNAGGATFQLNGKDIGPLGKRGSVVRNAVITAANLNN
jgi:transcriptional regulator with XRE-family HTH domain